MRVFLFLAMFGAAAFACAQDRVRVAILGPMQFVQGADHWAGAEMARDEINAGGGISVRGRVLQIELLRVDTNEVRSVSEAVRAMEHATGEDRADFVVGGFRAEAVLAMQDAAMQRRKIFLGVGAGDARLGEKVETQRARYKYWFRVAPSKSPDMLRSLMAVLEWIGDAVRASRQGGLPRVAIVAEKAAWSEALAKGAQDAVTRAKMEVVGTWQPSPLATDVGAELAAIEHAGADIVFTLLSGPVGVALGRQMGERGTRAVAFGINVEAQKDDYWRATGGKPHLAATLDYYAEADITPKTAAFVRAFRQRHGRMPTHTAATYDALYVLKAAIERAGSTDADALVPVLEKLEHVGTGAVISWDRRHDPAWAIGRTAGIAVQWQDGSKVPFWPPTVSGTRPFRLPPR